MKLMTLNNTLKVFGVALFIAAATVKPANAQLFGLGRRIANNQSADAMPKARTALSEKIKLEAQNGRLSIEFPKEQDAEALIQSIVENSYRSSHSSNGDRYSCNAESNVARITINSGTDRWGQQQKDIKTIQLTELNDATNRVEIKVDTDQEQLSLLSFNLKQEKFHFLRQTPDLLTLVAIDGESFDYMSEKSINDLVAQPNFTSILDRFRAAGFGVPKLASQSNIETLVESILKFSDSDREKFENAFPDLTSKKFKRRKAAAGELAKKLDQHIVAVAAMLLSDTLPLEMRARFLEAIQGCQDEATVLLVKTIVDGKLTTAPPVLLKLLTHQTQAKATEETLQFTIQRLQDVTGQKFGSDVEAWSNWIAENAATVTVAKKTAPAPPQKKTAQSKRRRLRKTGREQVEHPLKDLLKLKLGDSGRIEIDRDHWRALFNNKSPRELMQEAKRSFIASGLPKSWLVLGGEHGVTGVGYEQILFERIADEVKVRSRNYETYSQGRQQKTKSLNRTMNKSDLRMTLMLHDQSSRRENVRRKRAYFKFMFEDDAEDLFYLLIAQPRKGFRIFLFWDNGKTVLNLHCDQQGRLLLHHIADKRTTKLSAESVSKLTAENGDFLNTQLLPLLSKIGIDAARVFADNDNDNAAE